eukprot:3590672-Lingulodinium_polyedra.AAC.1
MNRPALATPLGPGTSQKSHILDPVRNRNHSRAPQSGRRQNRRVGSAVPNVGGGVLAKQD